MSLSLILPMLVGYLLGAIPTGLLLTRMAGRGDIRNVGSGNIGATNVLRTGSKALAAMTLAGDLLKGTLAVIIAPDLALLTAAWLGGGQVQVANPIALQDTIRTAMLAGAYGAFLGHLYPVWIGFVGGKGVATFIGILLGLYWPGALIFCAAWLLTAFIFRVSSLAALVASAGLPIALIALGRPELAIPLIPLVFLLFWKHRANIGRLMSGEEPKIGTRSK
ncbi:MAG: glycerol-3-phosphate 1-O-acyltransferase PlsY [Pseudomonadota bacterium]